MQQKCALDWYEIPPVQDMVGQNDKKVSIKFGTYILREHLIDMSVYRHALPTRRRLESIPIAAIISKLDPTIHK